MASKQEALCIQEVKHCLNNWFQVWAKKAFMFLIGWLINLYIIIIIIII